MKTNISYLISLLIVLFSGCKNDSITDTDIQKITIQRDSLIESSIKKDSLINTFVSSFIEIENNLVNIKQKEEIISLPANNNVELKGSFKDEVIENIKIINELMDKSRQKITLLNAKLKESNFKNEQVTKLVDILNTQIDYKNQELITLNKKLTAHDKITTKLNAEMIEIGVQNVKKTKTINEKNNLLNTAYYAVGTLHELEYQGLVVTKGGVVGVGEFPTLNANLGKSIYSSINVYKINIYSTTKISIAAKKIKLITPHPEGSYRFEDGIDQNNKKLVIVNPDEFWKISKYLIIEVDSDL